MKKNKLFEEAYLNIKEYVLEASDGYCDLDKKSKEHFYIFESWLQDLISKVREEEKSRTTELLESMLDDGRPLGDVIKEKLKSLDSSQ